MSTSAVPLLNPPLHQGQIPGRAAEGETFILRRKGITFEIRASEGLFENGSARAKANGEMFLTNMRLLFVATKQRPENPLALNAFECPLATITGQKFQQPIFGVCN